MIRKVVISVVVEEDCKKMTQTKTRVAPYVRVRNGKKELVKGYLRKK